MEKLAIVHSPLGEKLWFYHMVASEYLSQVPKFTLDLHSEDPDIDFSELLGKYMSVELFLPEGTGEKGKRFFGGYVSRISYTGMNTEFHQYRVIVQPWLAFLNNNQDYRIFQNKTVIEILKEVFSRDERWAKRYVDATTPEVPATEYVPAHPAYEVRPYCVQYAESDLNFVLRLMEQEGISFYFTYEKDTHDLVLVDSPAGHDSFPGYEKIAYKGSALTERQDGESILTWQRTQQVKPGSVTLTDFDFTRSSVDLQQKRVEVKDHPLADMEVFNYPGFYTKEVHGEAFARKQMEAYSLLTQQAGGTSDARGLACGHTFTLDGFIRSQDNMKYLVTGTTIVVTQALESSSEARSSVKAFVKEASDQIAQKQADVHGSSFHCEFSVIDAKLTFRPQRITPKPRVQGPQTAFVVGPAAVEDSHNDKKSKKGESSHKDENEIYTDEYGRVKVHFHWDRYGKSDGNDTCWVRVSQVWAGQNFGFQAIPRIGQEVIVDFLEGDPDQPIITGRVHNDKQMPPWGLPEHKTQTGVLTRSTPDGHYQTANALRFEDKKGSEEVWLHAERNQRIEVENCESHTVGVDRSKTIGRNETTEVQGNRTEIVGTEGKEGSGEEKITVHGSRTEEVHKDERITIHKKRTKTVFSDEECTVHASRFTFANKEVNRVLKKQTNVVKGERLDQVGEGKTLEVGQIYRIEVGGAFHINCGESAFSMNANGLVMIKGKIFNFSATEDFTMNGGHIDLNPEGGGPGYFRPSKGGAAIKADIQTHFNPAVEYELVKEGDSYKEVEVGPSLMEQVNDAKQ